MADEPPYLTLGTEVSAKFKGAFCEAKIKKVSKSVKCKVTFTNSTNNSSYQIPDDDIQGNNLQIGAMVKAKHPQLNGQLFEAKIVKIIDSSAYTVEFDDGDVRVLKRNLICLKGQKHFQESQTLDKLPLTNPELFGTPVVTKKSTSNMSNSSSLSSSNNKTNSKNREKSKIDSMLKDNKEYRKSQSSSKNITSSSTADKKIKRDKRHTTAITTKLPERHKDGSHHRVKSVLDVDKESDSQKDHHKTFSKEKENVAVKNVAKDKDASRERKDTASERQGTLENLEENSEDEDEEEEESLEEKDHFVAQLYKFMEDRGTPLNKLPTIGTTDLNFHKLYKVVSALGYYNKVTNNEKWNEVCQKMGVFKQCDWPKSLVVKRVQAFYKKYLLRFEEFSRKLGCTLMTLPISSVNTSTFKSNSSSGGSASSVSLAANLESHHASERDKTLVTSGNGVNSGHYRNSLNLNVIMSATDNSNASHNIQGRSLIREKRFGKVLDKNNKSPTIPPSKSLGSDLPAKTSDRGTFKSGYKDSGGGKMRTSSSSSNSLSSISSTDNIPSTSGSLANQEDAAAFTPTTKDPKVNTYKANDDTAEREGGKAELSDQFKYSASYLYLKRKKSLQKLSLKSSNNVNVTRDNIKDSNTKLHEENFKVDSRKTDHSKMNEDSDRAVRRDKKAKLRDGDSSNQFDDARHSGVNTASLKRTAKDITADDKVEPRLLSSDQENEAKMVDQHRAHKKKVVKHSLPATDSKETILAKSEVLNPAIGGSHPKTVKAVDEKSVNISQRSVYDFTDIADFTVGDFCRKQESYTENIVDEKNPEFATRSAPIMGPYLNTPLIDIHASVFSLPDIGATRSGLDFGIKAPSSHDEFEGPQQKFDDSFSVPNEVDKSGPQDYLPLIADSIKFETEIGDDVVISSNDSQIRDSFVDKDKILESEETNTGNGNGNTRSSRRLEARKRQTTILKLGPENLYSISEITKVIPCSNENKEPAISNPINEEGFGALPAKDSEIKTSDAERNPPTLIVDQNAPPAEDKIAEESYPISEIKMADEENKDHELANENAVSVTRPEKLNDDEQKQALKESLNLSSTISSKLFDDMLKKEEDGSIADDERENNKSLINNDDAGNIFKSFGGNMGFDLMNSTFASEKDEINESSKDKITTPSSQRKKSQTIFALPPEIQTNFVCTYDFLALDSNLLLNAKISATKTNINTLRKVYQKHKSKVSEIDKILKNIQKMEENGSSSTDIKEYYNNIKENISLASVSSDSSSPE